MSKTSKNVLAKIEAAGISAKSVIMPAVILILCLHLLIILNTLRINRLGQDISRTMQVNFSYAQVLKSYESVYGEMADKARLYVDTGDMSALEAYFQIAQALEERGDAVSALTFSDPSGPAYEDIGEAQEAVRTLIRLERGAMRMRAGAAGVDMSRYPGLEEAGLSAAEEALGASGLLNSEAYLQGRTALKNSIDHAMEHMSKFTSQTIGQTSARLGRYRALQWVMTIIIIAILSVMCVLLFTLLLNPLELSVEQIQCGAPLPVDKGLLEFRRLAYSYNELLHHRKMMESYLRKQSQTDALTKLPNRMAFQNYVAELSWEKAHSSVTVFSLDVNGLKETNDTNGHTYGDDLLRRSAACIQAVFGGDDESRQCFRFGGDEFAAFWVNVPQEEIQTALSKFREEQAAQNVSISVGYAFAKDLSETTVEELFEQADKVMYAEKAKHHRKLAEREQ